MKIAVVYSSKSGFTKRYAQWLSEALPAELIALNEVQPDRLQDFDLLLYGGGLYAGGINGLKKFNGMTHGVPKEKIIYFATGATPEREDVAPELIQHNFSAAEQDKVQFFYMRGGFDFNLLGFVDRLLMNMLKFSIKRKKEEDRTPDEKGMLASYEQAVDFTRTKNIEPILEFIQTKVSKAEQE